MHLDQVSFGAGIVLGLGALAWAIYTEVRIRKLVAENLTSKVAIQDANVTQAVSKLSDPQLAATLATDLGRSTRDPKT